MPGGQLRISSLADELKEFLDGVAPSQHLHIPQISGSPSSAVTAPDTDSQHSFAGFHFNWELNNDAAVPQQLSIITEVKEEEETEVESAEDADTEEELDENEPQRRRRRRPVPRPRVRICDVNTNDMPTVKRAANISSLIVPFQTALVSNN